MDFEQSMGLLYDIELDGHAAVRLAGDAAKSEVLDLGRGMWWSWIGMCRSRWTWWLATGSWHGVRWLWQVETLR